eukprot:11713314-Alexandrium_andersonii.AAC.1
MLRALLGEQGPPPGLQPPDCGPGPKSDFKEDPCSDIELDFFKPLPGAQPRHSLQRRTPPPSPPLPGISQT